MKNFKEEIFKEMDARLPEMSERLREYPITTNETNRSFKLNWKVFTPILTVLLIMLIVTPFLFKEQSVNEVYILEVNPTVIITTKDGIVSEVKSGNKDADKILYCLESNQIIGQKLNDAAKVIAEELLQLGYFSASSANIMKITSTKQNEDLNESLIDYFQEKGFFLAIYNPELSLEEFNLKFGTKSNKLSDINKYITGLKDHYIENISIENDDLEMFYKTNYLEDYLLNTLEKQIDNITARSNCLLEIYDIYKDILTNDAFPIYLRDYWVAKNYYDENPDKISEDIKLLLDKMHDNIKYYEALTGNLIDSSTELLEIYSLSLQMPISELIDIMEHLHEYISSSEHIDKITNLINYLMSVIPTIKDELEDFIIIPNDKESLIAKIKNISLRTNQVMKKEYLSIYQEQRDQISEEDYRIRLEEIINIYGNVENFWKNYQNVQ